MKRILAVLFFGASAVILCALYWTTETPPRQKLQDDAIHLERRIATEDTTYIDSDAEDVFANSSLSLKEALENVMKNSSGSRKVADLVAVFKHHASRSSLDEIVTIINSMGQGQLRGAAIHGSLEGIPLKDIPSFHKMILAGGWPSDTQVLTTGINERLSRLDIPTLDAIKSYFIEGNLETEFYRNSALALAASEIDLPNVESRLKNDPALMRSYLSRALARKPELLEYLCGPVEKPWITKDTGKALGSIFYHNLAANGYAKIAQIQNPEIRSSAVNQFAYAWLMADADAASRWINQLHMDKSTDLKPALTQLLNYLRINHETEALQQWEPIFASLK